VLTTTKQRANIEASKANEMEDLSMKRTISIEELKNSKCNTWSVKDNSIRGYTTKSTSDVHVGDKVIIDNYFTEVVDA
jgi:hypothetical protein